MNATVKIDPTEFIKWKHVTKRKKEGIVLNSTYSAWRAEILTDRAAWMFEVW